MKRLFTLFAIAMAIVVSSCNKYDDSKVWETLDDHESRITTLEELCKQMNTNITALQTIVTALQNNDYVQSVTPLMEDGKEIGYTITFTKSGTIAIYHGEDGENGTDGKDGEDGANGANGADGHTPIIGVKQGDDNIYYWTVDGEWLLDNEGNKIKAQGTDGKDGENGANGADGNDGKDGQNGENGADGKDGITPQLKIENGYWLISYDNGTTWSQLGKATGENGENGKDGKNGDSMFSNVDYTNKEYVVFTLADGTQIKLPTWSAFEQLQSLCNQMNSNIEALQTIIGAIQNNDYVSKVEPIIENGATIGYTIYFTKSSPVTIYHGKDGQNGSDGVNGEDGADGANGADGHTPIIGVKQGDDNIYYWTVDGEWLLDNEGNKIKAQGTDGKDGENGANGADGNDGKDGQNGENGADGKDGEDGKDGITPQLKIENGYWLISYDNGTTWAQLGKATGENGTDGVDGENGKDGADGKDGEDGDSFFQSVTQDENNVYFVLADGTTLTVPLASSQLFNRLQSVTYIPKYTDGKATLIKTENVDEGIVEFDFLISPKSAAKDIAANWESVLSMECVETITRAVEYIDMPILSCEADNTKCIITITASGENISDTFYTGELTLNAVLIISDGNNQIASDFIEMVGVVNAPVAPAKNEIWYTSSNGSVVTPDTTDVFGANIVSNVYEDGKGVITFDGEVTEIGKWAFSNCKSLTSVTIPDSVTTIGYGAFFICSSLTSVTIPDSVTTIGEQAFRSCSSLTSITIPDSVTEIGSFTFGHCYGLTSVTIPDSVTTIGEETFAYCTNLKKFEGKFAADNGRCLIKDNVIIAYANSSGTEYTIPDSVTTIESYAFRGCSSLTNVTIGDSVTTIGNGAFYSCTSLTSVTIGDNVTEIVDNPFSDCTSLKKFEGKFAADNGRCLIKDNVIIAYANSSGTEYTIPDSVTEIGKQAFDDCSSLTSVTIPDSVTTIAFGAFYYCTSLKEVYCKTTTPPTGNNFMFHHNASDRKIYVPASNDDSIINTYKAATYWSDYKDYIFEMEEPKPANNEIWYTNGSTTESITPQNKSYGGFGANIISNVYDENRECWVITFDQTITVVGDSAFSKCSSLTSVTLPDSVTEIKDYAFYKCTSLESISLGDGLTSIGNGAFTECGNIKKVDISNLTAWCAIDFEYGKNPLYYGADLYLNGNKLTNLIIPSDVTELKYPAFNGCTSITSATIPSSVTYIEFALQGCSNLTNVTLPNSITAIGEWTFSGCNNLETITIPNSVTSIGKYAFSGCSSLTNLTLGDNVESIEDHAFNNCTALATINFGERVKSIGTDAFGECNNIKKVNISSLTSWCAIDFNRETNPLYYGADLYLSNNKVTNLIIPSDVYELKEYTFIGCKSITSVTIPDSVTSIASCVFESCTSLTDVTISDSVTHLDGFIFQYCSSLKNIYIGNSVTSIGNYLFRGCTSLSSVTIPNSVTTIGDSAFDGTSITSIIIPESVTKIENYAFIDCASLKEVYCKAKTPPTGGTSMFARNAANRKIYVPTESTGAYKAASGWSNYADVIVGYNF